MAQPALTAPSSCSCSEAAPEVWEWHKHWSRPICECQANRTGTRQVALAGPLQVLVVLPSIGTGLMLQRGVGLLEENGRHLAAREIFNFLVKLCGQDPLR